MNFFIADLHLLHQHCLEYEGNVFTSVEDRVSAIVSRWNSVVSAQDTVYVLGDVCCTHSASLELEAAGIVAGLHGTKVLVRGNHDYLRTAAMSRQFVKIADIVEVDDCVLCHYPLMVWNRQHYGRRHMYGHMHLQPLPHKLPGSCCVSACLPHMDYTPRTLTELESYFEKGVM